MDPFELFETESERHGRRSTTAAGRPKVSRGFSRRWMAFAEDNENDDGPVARRRGNQSRRHGWD